ncbi:MULTISPECIES: LLM class flavin-dependent oxidoreductase [unclassified Streptomyces]|uniref:LLM class flavin-dependent oxidoreductase n=1 Tax=unclassified Streptomyces TaxID=2593676 RepID=UPI001F545FEF|nr:MULTISPECIES: LLM class flavin-dependent oxidoreductase [unclassified Streptomyces]
MTLRMGVDLTFRGPTGADQSAVMDEQLALLAAVRAAGWDSVFVGHAEDRHGAAATPLPLLGRVSAVSGDMRLVAGVRMADPRDVVRTAETYAVADALSGGRLVFAAALAGRAGDNRAARDLGAIARLWAGEDAGPGRPGTAASRLTVRPAQRPRPRVWVAADDGLPVPEAALIGDGWLTGAPATMTAAAARTDLVRSLRAGAGLPPHTEVALIREVVCAPDRATAVARALDRGCAPGTGTGTAAGLDPPLAGLTRDRLVIGDPEDCLRILRAWTERLRATEVILRVHSPGAPFAAAMESVELLNTEVLPYL